MVMSFFCSCFAPRSRDPSPSNNLAVRKPSSITLPSDDPHPVSGPPRVSLSLSTDILQPSRALHDQAGASSSSTTTTTTPPTTPHQSQGLPPNISSCVDQRNSGHGDSGSSGNDEHAGQDDQDDHSEGQHVGRESKKTSQHDVASRSRIIRHLSFESISKKRRSRLEVGRSDEEVARREELKRIRRQRIADELRHEDELTHPRLQKWDSTHSSQSRPSGIFSRYPRDGLEFAIAPETHARSSMASSEVMGIHPDIAMSPNLRHRTRTPSEPRRNSCPDRFGGRPSHHARKNSQASIKTLHTTSTPAPPAPPGPPRQQSLRRTRTSDMASMLSWRLSYAKRVGKAYQNEHFPGTSSPSTRSLMTRSDLESPIPEKDAETDTMGPVLSPGSNRGTTPRLRSPTWLLTQSALTESPTASRNSRDTCHQRRGSQSTGSSQRLTPEKAANNNDASSSIYPPSSQCSPSEHTASKVDVGELQVSRASIIRLDLSTRRWTRTSSSKRTKSSDAHVPDTHSEHPTPTVSNTSQVVHRRQSEAVLSKVDKGNAPVRSKTIRRATVVRDKSRHCCAVTNDSQRQWGRIVKKRSQSPTSATDSSHSSPTPREAVDITPIPRYHAYSSSDPTPQVRECSQTAGGSSLDGEALVDQYYAHAPATERVTGRETGGDDVFFKTATSRGSPNLVVPETSTSEGVEIQRVREEHPPTPNAMLLKFEAEEGLFHALTMINSLPEHAGEEVQDELPANDSFTLDRYTQGREDSPHGSSFQEQSHEELTASDAGGNLEKVRASPATLRYATPMSHMSSTDDMSIGRFEDARSEQSDASYGSDGTEGTIVRRPLSAMETRQAASQGHDVRTRSYQSLARMSRDNEVDEETTVEKAILIGDDGGPGVAVTSVVIR